MNTYRRKANSAMTNRSISDRSNLIRWIRRTRGNASMELVLIMPLTLVIIMIFFWMTRTFSAKHGSTIESNRDVHERAMVVEYTGNDRRTETVSGLHQSDLEYFLSKWPTRKNLRKGLVKGHGEVDSGRGVLAHQEGAGTSESSDWLLTDTWQQAFVFPKSAGEQPMMTLPKTIPSILPRGASEVHPTTFRQLLNF